MSFVKKWLINNIFLEYENIFRIICQSSFVCPKGLIYFIGWKKVILCGHWYKIVTFKTPAKRKDVNGIRTGMPYFYDTGNGFTRYEAEWYI